MNNGTEAAGRPRTLHAATKEEEVEEFVLKEWPAGNVSHSRRQIFRLLQKPDISLTSNNIK